MAIFRNIRVVLMRQQPKKEVNAFAMRKTFRKFAFGCGKRLAEPEERI